MVDAKMQNLTPGEADLVDILSKIIVGLVLGDEKKRNPRRSSPGGQPGLVYREQGKGKAIRELKNEKNTRD